MVTVSVSRLNAQKVSMRSFAGQFRTGWWDRTVLSTPTSTAYLILSLKILELLVLLPFITSNFINLINFINFIIFIILKTSTFHFYFCHESRTFLKVFPFTHNTILAQSALQTINKHSLKNRLNINLRVLFQHCLVVTRRSMTRGWTTKERRVCLCRAVRV